ncbi:hypothetical protein F5Y08DRAFT_346586 [Xylaria arbuscula]|nr:hypothetical protein F5Y08DRAFT_346586 [Xylaria arbuscula]
MALARPSSHWLLYGSTSIPFQDFTTFNCLVTFLEAPSYFLPDDKEIHDSVCMYFSLPPSIVNLQSTFAPLNVQFREHSPHMRSLFAAICAFAGGYSASRPHDFIYGMLGIFPKCNIQPDYLKSVREIYLEAFLSDEDIEWSLGLTHSGSRFNMSNYHDLPSWLPDFSQFDNKLHSFAPYYDKVLVLGMHMDTKPQVSADGIQFIDGIIYDHVELVKNIHVTAGDRDEVAGGIFKLCVDYLVDFFGVKETFRYVLHGFKADWQPGHIANTISGKSPLGALLALVDWKEWGSRSRMHELHIDLSGPALPSVAWCFHLRLFRLCELGRNQELDSMRRLKLTKANLGYYLAQCLADTRFTDDELITSPDRRLTCEIDNDKVDEIFLNAHRKTLFKTRTGHLGLGPPGMKSGDLVCAMSHCQLPMLLRKIPAQEPYMEHVGPCYVLGISDGELAEKLDKGELTLQQLKIR